MVPSAIRNDEALLHVDGHACAAVDSQPSYAAARSNAIGGVITEFDDARGIDSISPELADRVLAKLVVREDVTFAKKEEIFGGR